jgi:hypothetical protein
MSIICKVSVAGIFAVIAWLGITGAAWADDPLKAPQDGIEANGPRGRLWDTADYVHVVKVERSTAARQFVITLRIDDGFHINANPASLPYLIPTSVTFVGVSPFRIRYPIPIRFKPKFTEEPLNVYEGTILITASFMKGVLDRASALHAAVTAQACTDQICLPPEDLPVSE